MTAPRRLVALPDGEVVDVSEFLSGVVALTAGGDQPGRATGITAVVAEMVHGCDDWASGRAQESSLERYFRTRTLDLRLLARHGFAVTLTPGWGVDLLCQRASADALTERVTRLAAAQAPGQPAVPRPAGLAALELRVRAISAEATDMYLEWLELLTLRYRDVLAGESSG